MKIELLKPIPKYILVRIQKLDMSKCPEPSNGTRLYSYLTKIQNELVKVTVAVRNHRKKWYSKQVTVHGVKSDKCYVRDFEYACMGMGYRVGWYAERLTTYEKWFEGRGWCYADCKYYNAHTVLVNPEYVDRFPEYRYSAYKFFDGKCVIEYLRLYEKYPQTEYLLKNGLHKFHNSKMILKRVATDRTFYKWLIVNKAELTASYFYNDVVIRAYRTGKPLKQLQALAEFKKKLNSDKGLRPVKDLFRGNLSPLLAYLETQNASPHSYRDYLNACNYLGLDMSISKNRFPHDFKYWHNLRIDESAIAKVVADEQAKAELYKRYSLVVSKYLSLQNCKKGAYAVFIAASPAELIQEGETLHHCVGKSGYEQKTAREETLIFFVRELSKPDVPFVTLEYSLQSKKVLQCYGFENTKPNEEVTAYINKVWLPYVSRKIKKICV